jgi:hypothetical protein
LHLGPPRSTFGSRIKETRSRLATSPQDETCICAPVFIGNCFLYYLLFIVRSHNSHTLPFAIALLCSQQKLRPSAKTEKLLANTECARPNPAA